MKKRHRFYVFKRVLAFLQNPIKCIKLYLKNTLKRAKHFDKINYLTH